MRETKIQQAVACVLVAPLYIVSAALYILVLGGTIGVCLWGFRYLLSCF
jgi:hypothetical protein